MPVAKYVVVDVPTKKILDGPFLWDATATPDWAPPTPGTVMLMSAAMAGGYTVPAAAPDVAEQLRARIPAALDANVAFLTAGTPSNAQLLAQVRLLTRQVSALGRLAVQQLDSTDGT